MFYVLVGKYHIEIPSESIIPFLTIAAIYIALYGKVLHDRTVAGSCLYDKCVEEENQ